jgi:hypothetical protein
LFVRKLRRDFSNYLIVGKSRPMDTIARDVELEFGGEEEAAAEEDVMPDHPAEIPDKPLNTKTLEDRIARPTKIAPLSSERSTTEQ